MYALHHHCSHPNTRLPFASNENLLHPVGVTMYLPRLPTSHCAVIHCVYFLSSMVSLGLVIMDNHASILRIYIHKTASFNSIIFAHAFVSFVIPFLIMLVPILPFPCSFPPPHHQHHLLILHGSRFSFKASPHPSNHRITHPTHSKPVYPFYVSFVFPAFRSYRIAPLKLHNPQSTSHAA